MNCAESIGILFLFFHFNLIEIPLKAMINANSFNLEFKKLEQQNNKRTYTVFQL